MIRPSVRFLGRIAPSAAALLIVAACWATDCRAELTPPPDGKGPAKPAASIPLGIWITSIGKFNFPDNTFRATFWIWGKLPKGEEKLLTQLDFVNAESHSLLNTSTLQESGGSVTYQKVAGTFRKEWNLKNYPFDRHRLSICIDACETTERLNLTANAETSGFDPEINAGGNDELDGVNGWKITGFRILSSHRNDSGSPDKNLNTAASCSRLIAEIEIHRCSYAVFWKMTAAAFAAVILVIITYFLPIEGPENMSPYFATFVGAVFAIVINLKSANSELGTSSGMTLIDKIHLEALAYVVLGAVVTLAGRLRIAAGIPAATINFERAMIALLSLVLMAASISWQVYRAVTTG